MYEYRSDNKDCMDTMKAFFENTIAVFKNNFNAKIDVEIVGERPCGGDVDMDKLNEMTEKVIEICKKYTGMECISSSGSTDCNIPQSLGVAAVCPGVYYGGGAHTREEWVEKSSIPVGLKIVFELILGYFN